MGKAKMLTLIGSVSVDSGTFAITDEQRFTFEEWTHLGIEAAPFGAPSYGGGHSYVVKCPEGDGVYPIYVEVDEDGDAERIIINLREYVDSDGVARDRMAEGSPYRWEE